MLIANSYINLQLAVVEPVVVLQMQNSSGLVSSPQSCVDIKAELAAGAMGGSDPVGRVDGEGIQQNPSPLSSGWC